MSKWYGKIGYATTVEYEPGCWEEQIAERSYYGDMTKDYRRRQNNGEINDALSLSNVLSILADPFAYENCSKIAYAEIMGAKWKITDVDASNYPRLILTIGGIWNGNSPGTSE